MYSADYALATDNALIQRVQMAIVETAINIQSESVATANHSQRSAYALLVLENPLGYAQRMAPGFTTGGLTYANDASGDTALATRASSVWNAYSCQT